MARPHGVRGEVKLIPLSDDTAHLLGLERVFIGPDAAKARAFEVEGARSQQTKRGAIVLVRFGGFDTREEASRLQGQSVFAHEDDLPLDDDEFFLHDLVGLDVESDEGTPIGTVRDVLPGAAQDLLVVARPDAPDALVPLVDEFLEEIDFDAGIVRIRPIEGLLDG